MQDDDRRAVGRHALQRSMPGHSILRLPAGAIAAGPGAPGAGFSRRKPRTLLVGEDAVMQDTRQWVLRIAVGALTWAIFLLLPGLFNPSITQMGVDAVLRDLFYIPSRLANAVFYFAVFYLNYFLLIPQLYLRRRYGLYFLSFLGCLAAFILLNVVVMGGAQDPMPPGTPGRGYGPPGSVNGPPPPGNAFFKLLGPSHNLFLFLIAFGASFTLRLYKQWRLVAQEKAVAEIAFLKAQMAPHFLFNTLNSIYSLALSKSDEAPEAVLKLSSLLRYNVSEAKGARVSLSKELEYIRAYMDLQRLRFSEKVSLWCEITGEEDGLEIEPFLLIPFIENAFKHGVNSEEASDIQVFIRIRGTELHLGVSNRKVTVQRRDEDSTGVGIENTRQRLVLLYPGRHDIEIDDGPVYFTVNLEIDLQ